MHAEYKILRDNYYPIMAALILRDGYRCARCSAYRPLVADHIVAVKRDGKTELDNLQLLCKSCNGIKANETTDFRPSNRGRLGYETPRYTECGVLIIRSYNYGYGRNEGFYTEDNEVIRFTAKQSIKVLRQRDQRVINISLSWVYPPDLQHIFQAAT